MTKPTSLELTGCTSSEQALRLASARIESITTPPSADLTTTGTSTVPSNKDNPMLGLQPAVNVNVPTNLLQPGKSSRVTRLKMTLHNVTPLDTTADDPLARCTFGAVYSPDKTEEDYVYGKYTPYGSLTYNVRADIAEHLVPGQAYFIDIHAVPT